jgi:hypothetical protein
MCAMMMLDKAPIGSQIVLCTDGMANCGMGALQSTYVKNNGSQFYTKLAKKC